MTARCNLRRSPQPCRLIMDHKIDLYIVDLIHPFLQALAESGRQNDIVVHSRSSTRVDGTTNVREGDITDHGVL